MKELMTVAKQFPHLEFIDFGGGFPIPYKPNEKRLHLDAGAYGFSMASQYNSRPLPAEVLINNGKILLIRKRQMFEDIVRGTMQ